MIQPSLTLTDSCLVEQPVESQVDLSRYSNSWYRPGPFWKRAIWFVVNVVFFRNPLSPSSAVKRVVLRAFGARIGTGVVIKPGVSIKYPWFLSIGDHSWIGEGCWIDNLGRVEIGRNACLSQRAMLLCGNHDYKKATFDLIVGNIVIGDGAWIGACSVVAPSVTVGDHAVLTVGSVAASDLARRGVYRGNPAVLVRPRKLAE
jgi:putative colanic acid biosynthesis acetyltransferase WcaF